MKIQTLFLILFTLPLFCSGQQSKIQHFYYTHAAAKGAKHVSVECDLKQDEKGSNRRLGNMLYAKLLIMEDEQPDEEAVSKLISDSQDEAFDMLVDVRSKGEELHLLVKELEGDKLNFLAIARDETNFIYANVAGIFSINDLLALELGNVDNVDDLINKIKKMEQCAETD